MKNILNTAQLKYVFDQINKLAKEKYNDYRLSLSWLLNKNNKNAVLFIYENNKNDVACLLSDLNGTLIYEHKYKDYHSDCYYEVFEYFEKKYDAESSEICINKFNTEKYKNLIVDTKNNMDYMFKYCRQFEWIAEILSHDHVKKIEYICSIFKLNQLYNIRSSDIPSTFYLRFGITNEENKMILYYDVEYDAKEDEDYLFIDEYIIDIVYHQTNK